MGWSSEAASKKIKTIGDAYMPPADPQPREDHAQAVADIASKWSPPWTG
jgi:hypothetical protein